MRFMKILKLSASWCAPCRVFATTFHNVEKMEEYKDITFKEVDIENDEDGELLAAKYQVRSVPTTILLDENDNLIYKVSGNISQKDFIEIINNAINNETI